MEDEVLIECVREYACLYDMADPRYMDMIYKSHIWKLIGEKLHQSDENCRKRWTNIRDQFKKNLNRRKTKSGQSAKTMRRYKYEHILQFLLPYIQNRNTSNIDDDNESVGAAKDAENDEEIDEELCTKPTTTVHSIENSYEAPPTPTTSQPPDDLNATRQGRVLRKRRIPHSMSRTPKENACTSLMKYILEKNQKAQAEMDPIEAFFQGLIPTVKRFSPYFQLLAKERIFSVLHQLELEQLNTPGRISQVYASPTTYESSTSSTPAETTTSNVIGRLLPQFSEDTK